MRAAWYWSPARATARPASPPRIRAMTAAIAAGDCSSTTSMWRRRRGVGRALVAAMAAEALASGGAFLWWNADEGDDAALAFHRQLARRRHWSRISPSRARALHGWRGQHERQRAAHPPAGGADRGGGYRRIGGAG